MSNNQESISKSSQVGNAAKMRDALDKLLNFLRWAYAQDYPVSRDKLADAIDIGVAALSATPRNCDRPECATTKEKSRRKYGARRTGARRRTTSGY